MVSTSVVGMHHRTDVFGERFNRTSSHLMKRHENAARCLVARLQPPRAGPGHQRLTIVQANQRTDAREYCSDHCKRMYVEQDVYLVQDHDGRSWATSSKARCSTVYSRVVQRLAQVILIAAEVKRIRPVTTSSDQGGTSTSTAPIYRTRITWSSSPELPSAFSNRFLYTD
jgi:hypothetical protein